MKLQKKLLQARYVYKSRHMKLEKKVKVHILKNKQSEFIEKYSPIKFHANMTMLTNKKKAKKKKDLKLVLDVIDQYDFYFKNLIFDHLSIDQSQERNQNLRSIILLNFSLEGVYEAELDLE